MTTPKTILLLGAATLLFGLRVEAKPAPAKKGWDSRYRFKTGSTGTHGMVVGLQLSIYCGQEGGSVSHGKLSLTAYLTDPSMRNARKGNAGLAQLRSSPDAKVALADVAVDADGKFKQTVKLSDANIAFLQKRAELAKAASDASEDEKDMAEQSKDLTALLVDGVFARSGHGTYADVNIAAPDQPAQGCSMRIVGDDFASGDSTCSTTGSQCRRDGDCCDGKCSGMHCN
jgi:hypothetical protein